MSVMTVLPRDHPWTVEDLALLPDDGLRYELVDGTLLVSAAPSKLHQRCLGNLYVLLRTSCPEALEVFLAPTDYQPTHTRSLQPDLLVVTRDDPGPAAVTTPLELAVEVLSPSSRSVDLVLKRELYRQAGVRSYWVVDPLVPSVDVWELDDDGQYGDPLTVAGDAELRLDAPYAVVLQPEALLR
jgi:Uma2 family endonuclease